jgi:hypothetical protein
VIYTKKLRRRFNKLPINYNATGCTQPTLRLSTLLRLGLPSGLFPSGFPTNNLYAFLFSPIRATWPAHLILLDLIFVIILGEEIWKIVNFKIILKEEVLVQFEVSSLQSDSVFEENHKVPYQFSLSPAYL